MATLETVTICDEEDLNTATNLGSPALHEATKITETLVDVLRTGTSAARIGRDTMRMIMMDPTEVTQHPPTPNPLINRSK